MKKIFKDNPEDNPIIDYNDEKNQHYETKTKFWHVVPNSEHYGELQHIINSLELGISKEEMIQTIQNTIRMGYEIQKVN